MKFYSNIGILFLTTTLLAGTLGLPAVSSSKPTKAAKEVVDKPEEETKAVKAEEKALPNGENWQEYLTAAKSSYNAGKVQDATNQLDLALSGAERLRVHTRADAFCKIADLYVSLELFDKAQGLLEESIKVKRKLPLQSQLTLANALDNLANVFTKKANWEEAEKLQKQASEIYLSQKNQGGSDYIIFLSNRANTAREQKHFAEAEKLLNEALTKQAKMEGANSLHTAVIYINLAGLFADQNQIEKAQDTLNKTEAILKKQNLPQTHPLLKLLRKSQRVVQKKKIDQLLKTDTNPYRPEMAQELVMLGEKYVAEDDFSQAAETYKKALNIQEKVFSKEDARLTTVLEAYANCLRKLGDTEEASKLEERALAIKQLQ